MDPIVIFGLILVVLVISLIVLYNGIIGAHNRAQRAWADVLTYERQKTKVLDALQPQVGNYQDYEQKLLTDITQLRSAIAGLPAAADGRALVTTEKATLALLDSLRVTYEAYPDLKAAEIVTSFMREIAEQQENIGAAVTVFNREVELFNNKIQMFPGSFVNGTFNKKSPITPFSDAEAQKGFEYKPNF